MPTSDLKAAGSCLPLIFLTRPGGRRANEAWSAAGWSVQFRTVQLPDGRLRLIGSGGRVGQDGAGAPSARDLIDSTSSVSLAGEHFCLSTRRQPAKIADRRE